MRLRILLLTLLVVSASACDSAEPDNEIGGLYVATETEDGVTARFALDIPTTDGGSFTLGNDSEISFTSDGATISLDVTGSGTYDHPNVSVTARVSSGGTTETISLTGTASESGGSISLRDNEGTTSVFTRQ